MAEAETPKDAPDGAKDKKKASKLPLLLGLVACLLFGGGGFYAAYSGMLGGLVGDEAPAKTGESQAADSNPPHATDDHGTQASSASDTAPHGATYASTTAAFVELDPLVVSLGTGQNLAHLRFRAHLEVSGGSEDSVAALMPRVMDVLNGYLRALKPEELADPTMLIRLRAQMLRRVQLVIGEDLVKDLLIAEFVLN